MTVITTPNEAGCRWPAEWEPHRATWLAWPHNRDTWPGRFDRIAEPFSQFVRTLATFEPVEILVNDDVASRAKSMVGDLDDVTLHPIPTNDAWIRDYGPMFLEGPDGAGSTIVDWDFNSWGGKYPPWDKDNRVTREIVMHLAARSFQPGIVLEGGAIDGNGVGLLMTTESCLLDRNRNAEIGRPEMELILRKYCCASKVLWLTGGSMAGDDTNGHVDQLARFVSCDQVVVAVEDDPSDDNYEPLQTNLANLEAATCQLGQSLELIELPMPRPIVVNGQRLPASYCNFYIANGCVIVPQFDDAGDSVALATLKPLFPSRQVIGLPARELILGLGAFHCLSQQQPRAAENP